MNFKKNTEGYMGGFRWRIEKGERVQVYYNVKNKKGFKPFRLFTSIVFGILLSSIGDVELEWEETTM